MKKRCLSLLLALVMVLALAMPAFAEEITKKSTDPDPTANLYVKDKDGKEVRQEELTETLQDMGEDQTVYVYPEGTTFSVSGSNGKNTITEIKNLTTGKTVSAGSSFTPPKDGCVYRISGSNVYYHDLKTDKKLISEYVIYVKCDDRFPVPGSEALMASQESTGTATVTYGDYSSMRKQEVLLYPAETVFSTVSGREIYNVKTLNDEKVAQDPASFTLPDDGEVYRIYIPNTRSFFFEYESEFIYVKLDSGNNFQPVKTYAPGTFTDVPESAWYAANVKSAYELNLVSGTSATTFSPKNNISVAASIALAARIHSIYTTGQADFVQGSPWYQVYVDYAVENGIIQSGQFSNYNANISRRDFAGIMCHTMPAGEFQAINTIEENSIPDVAEGSRYQDEIYTFYKAGISVGNDDAGTFTPEAAIQRSAAAALVTRMVDPSLRIKGVKLTTIVRPTKITLDSTASSLEVNRSIRLYTTTEPDEITVPITWTSSNPSVATVSSSGIVHGVSAGTATITAAYGTVSASCTVTVTPAEAIDPMSYAYNALDYLYKHLKFPSTMKILSISCGIYDRAGRDGTIYSPNDKYYAVTIVYQAANSFGAMTTDSYVTLFNQTKGMTYYDFVDYTDSWIDDAWGARKIAWMNLKNEALALANGVGSRLTEAQIQQLVSQVTK